jgi:hypothetical protein
VSFKSPISSFQTRLVELLAGSEQAYELLPSLGAQYRQLRRPIASAASQLLEEAAAPRVLVIVSRPASIRHWCKSWERTTTLTVAWPEDGHDGVPSGEQVNIITVNQSARHYADLLVVGYDLVVSDRLVDRSVSSGIASRLGKRHWQIVEAKALEESSDTTLGLRGLFLLGELFQPPPPRGRLSPLAERVNAQSARYTSRTAR